MFKARSRGEYAVLNGEELQVGEVKYDVETCRKYWRKEDEDNNERKKRNERENREGKKEEENKSEEMKIIIKETIRGPEEAKPGTTDKEFVEELGSQEKREVIREVVDKGAVEAHKVRNGDKEEEEIKTDEKKKVIEEENRGPADGERRKEVDEQKEVNTGTMDKETLEQMKRLFKENCKKMCEEIRDKINERAAIWDKKIEERHEERSGEREEKVEGEIRKKIKENGRKIFGIEEQHKRSNEEKLEGKQTRKIDVIKFGKDKGEESSFTNIDGKWKLSYCSNTGYQDYCNESYGMQCNRNMSHGKLQKTHSKLSLQEGKWSRPKDTYHTWRKREYETRYFDDVSNRQVI